AMLTIERQPRGTIARRQRPAGFDSQLVGVQRQQLVLVLKVHEQLSLPIAYPELRLAAELNFADDCPVCRVYRSRVFASPVEGENVLCGWVVKNRVWIVTNLDLSDCLESLHHENTHCAFAAIAGETTIEFGRKRDSMNAWSVADLPNLFSRVSVQYQHVSRS